MVRRRPSRAFTLVELLVVIFVIGLLIGLLMPALSRARETSYRIRCASNLRQWALATILYANQEHGWLPRRGQGVQITSQIDRPSDWFNALPPMLRKTTYFDLTNANQIPRPGDNSIWMCPSTLDSSSQYVFSYAMNMRLSTWNAANPDRLNKVGPWTNMVLLTEGPGPFCSVLPTVNQYTPVARHGGRVNIAFLDGHVENYIGKDVGCGLGDPKRSDVRWTVPDSPWAGPPGDTE